MAEEQSWIVDRERDRHRDEPTRTAAARQTVCRSGFADCTGPHDDEVITAAITCYRPNVRLWSGWWGPEPPYHAPVFVLTHHRHDSIQMDGGTTFHFVTDGFDGFDAAYSAACDAAGGNGVDIAGGASTVRQALTAGVIDELTLDIAPVLLGSGERIFDGVESFDFEPVEVLHSPLTTHIRYRRVN
jgi:dihydrofolate reductase